MAAIPYIIQVQICLALFWLVYRLCMRSSGAFAHNRAYLLATAALSFIVPALSIPVWTAAPVRGTVDVGDLAMWLAVVEEAEPAVAISWQAVVKWIAAAGIAVMGIGVARHIFRMVRSLRRAQVARVGKTRIVRHERIVAPYSFFNYIFVGEREAQSSEFPQIVAHEMAHVRLGHSYDSVFAQLMLVAFWWNPFVWLWSRSLKEEHEYQADNAVLQQGFDSKQYITLLIGTLADLHPEFVSGFSYSLLKNRLLMMTRSKGRYAALRALAALPILAGTLMLFSFTEKPAETTSVVATETPQTQTQPQPPPAEEPFVIVETMPKFQDGDIQAFRNWVQRNVRYPAIALENGIQGRVLTAFIVEKDGSVNEVEIVDSPDLALSNEVLRIVNTSPKWTPGQQRGQNVRVKLTLPVDFKVQGEVTTTAPAPATAEITGNPTIMVNGQLYTGGIDDIAPSAIQSIDVLKTDPAYPNGLMKITLKGAEPTTQELRVVGYGTARKPDAPLMSADSTIGIFFRSHPGGNNAEDPLFIIDDKVATVEDYKSLTTNTIESITILKDATATELYGEQAKNGVIIIKIKK